MEALTFVAIGGFILGIFLSHKWLHSDLDRKYKNKYDIQFKKAKEAARLEAYVDQETKKTAIIMANYWKVAQQVSFAFRQSHQLKALSEEYPRLKLIPEPSLLDKVIFEGFYKYEEKHPTSLRDRAIQAYLVNLRSEIDKTTLAKKAQPLNVCWIKDKAHWKKEPKNSVNINGALPSDWKWRRKIVIERDQHICQRCGFELAQKGKPERHIHHIIERSEGGSHEISNLILLCGECHTCMPAHDWMREEQQPFQPFQHHAFKQAYYRLNAVSLDKISALEELNLNDPQISERFRVLRKLTNDTEPYLTELKRTIGITE